MAKISARLIRKKKIKQQAAGIGKSRRHKNPNNLLDSSAPKNYPSPSPRRTDQSTNCQLPANYGPVGQSQRVEGEVASRGKDKELILIGTVHRDPDGAGRLRRLLASEGPAAVAVELSPYGLSYRRMNGRRLQRRLVREVKRLTKTRRVPWWEWGQISAVWAQLAVPYEYSSAVTYCRDMDRSLSCLDSSRWSKNWIDTQWQQLLSRDNLASLLEQIPENLRQEVGRDYRFAARLLGDGDQFLVSALSRRWSADPCWQQRESELASGLERLYRQLPRGGLAYVGGWQHLLGPSAGGTIYERLEHLQPRRVLLDGEAGMA